MLFSIMKSVGIAMDDFEYDYEKLLLENELMYDNFGDFNIPSLEYLIHIYVRLLLKVNNGMRDIFNGIF